MSDSTIRHTAPLTRWAGERETYHVILIDGQTAKAIAVHERLYRLEFGSRREFGSVKVSATIGDTRWKSSVLPQSDICGTGESPLDVVREGAEWLSLGADALSIAATATGVGAPIGGLVKDVQIGLEIGIAGINLYEASQTGNFSGVAGQVAGRLATRLVPGAAIGNKLRSSARLNWGQHANGRLRPGFHHRIAGQNQAIDEVNQGLVGSAVQGGGCVVR